MPTCCTSTTSANLPPQQSCRENSMFLLEFYVRHIKSARLAKLNQMFLVPTTVAFRFLDFKRDSELAVTPVDPVFEPQAGVSDDVELFHSGRSVLFALDSEAVQDMCKELKICLNVSKRMPPGISPDVLVGRATIDMTCQFAALRKELIDNTKYDGSYLPNQNPTKQFDDEVPLTFDDCECGRMGVFARLSAYGQTIVTEFEAPCIDDPSLRHFVFKADGADRDERSLGYGCRVLRASSCNLTELLDEEDEDEAELLGRRWAEGPRLPCSPCRVGSGARLAGGCQPAGPRAAPSDREPAAAPGNEQCPPVFGARGEPESSCGPKDPCARPIQTSRGPSQPCGKAVVLKVSGMIDVCNENAETCREARVTVTGEDEAVCPKDLNSDPDHDIFVLRIGKKGLVGAGEKSDIQLEMRTPKGPERGPPVRLETREQQTEEERQPKRSSKGKKKK